MLPVTKRFSKKDFEGLRPRVFFRHELFDIAYTEALPNQKYACVISKKTIKKAVDRNYVKRKVYTFLQTVSIPPTYSCVIYPKQKALTTPYSQFSLELQKAFATLR
jgi:ribonuclease P protein component